MNVCLQGRLYCTVHQNSNTVLVLLFTSLKIIVELYILQRKQRNTVFLFILFLLGFVRFFNTYFTCSSADTEAIVLLW